MGEHVVPFSRYSEETGKQYNAGWRNGVRAALQVRNQLAEDTQCDCNRCVLKALGLDPDDGA
jgi:hypothetical protein